MLKVIEGPVYKVLGGENNTNNYMQYINCFWNVLVTMTNKYLKLLLKRYLLPEYNLTLINNVLNEIIALRNLKITLEI